MELIRVDKLYGMVGKVLRVNLTTKEISSEEIGLDVWKKYLGGRGLGAYFLATEVPPSTDPLSAENKLVFMNGPLSGTMIPGNNKICVTFKSPLTNSYSYALCGGHFGPELKFSGYDGLIVEGKAEEPLYLWINNTEIELRSAKHIWGELIPKSEAMIRKELGDDKTIQIAVIGPAGERLVNYACITAGLYREFGRGGSGAVMGSKMLKGIAISGSKDVIVSDKSEVIKLSKKLIQSLRDSSAGEIRRQYGTMELVERINNAGFWVTRNYSEGYFEEGYKLEGKEMRDKIISGDSSCFGCPIACGKWTYTTSIENEKIQMEGPEFETVGMLGSNCGISRWETIMKAAEICDTYGFDTINAGACVSMLMEAYEKGRINKADTDGIELTFGNDKALLQVLEKIGKREGIGNVLARGVAKAAKNLCIEDLAVHSKGQSFPVYDPRGAKAMALTYATSPKGAHHMYATTFGMELAAGNRFEIEGKGQLEKTHQFSMALVDSIGLCSTMRAGISLEDQANAFSAVTGLDFGINDLNEVAERIINLERLYNVQIGFTRKNDILPKRFLEEPMPKGASKGQTVDLNALLDDYYSLMEWNLNGIPKDKKLKELGISNIF
ncbi:MAG: aldehyde ferredoxin oxidoreductase [Candidatus Lokiarchaeota archaeon]|nr:aldehyde ferredoxin oxidoreductase [Candidatus Lokiarchaeota archaeon]MBD3343410.1 aldehyde ferredoxin oxidoreductase [Candidatus Lokiarchaeota archaeon]